MARQTKDQFFADLTTRYPFLQKEINPEQEALVKEAFQGTRTVSLAQLFPEQEQEPTPIPSFISKVVNTMFAPITEQIATMIMQRLASHGHLSSTGDDKTCRFWPIGVIHPDTSQTFSLDGFVDWVDIVMRVTNTDTYKIVELHGEKTPNGWIFLLQTPLPDGEYIIVVQGKQVAQDSQPADILHALVCVAPFEQNVESHALENIVDVVDNLAGNHQFDDAVRVIESNGAPEHVASALVDFIKNKAIERYCPWMLSS